MTSVDPDVGPVVVTRRLGGSPSKPAPTWRDRLGKYLARQLSRRALSGTISVQGEHGGFLVGDGDDHVVVKVHHPGAYRRTLRSGSIGLAESFIDGWWETDDLTRLIQLQIRNLEPLLARLDRLVALIDRPWSTLHRLRPPKKSTDRRNVRAHYDLPGELFEVMLDETMMYSCAYFSSSQSSLQEAQEAKLEMICVKLALGPDDHVLEIGSGWGGFAIYAARTRGCRVTTTTLSIEQRRVAMDRIAAAGLSERIEVLDRDYRDLSGNFDKLVSIEMIEAVDWRLHETFFRTCERLLKPEGAMLLQAITIEDRSFARARFNHDFIKELIFPGGCLPSVSHMVNTVTRTTDLRVVGLEDIGIHYATTLRHWRENFLERWAAVAPPGFGSEFTRLWELYLCYCEAGFLERHVSDVQMMLAGPSWRGTTSA
ncbi:MAG: class I SAM-dependent methyltransferase [Acidimicrobiaceae bacterium]|nr:class I SAM-dependent methyltransferase [Acidimicrobiaceae bacterium]